MAAVGEGRGGEREGGEGSKHKSQVHYLVHGVCTVQQCQSHRVPSERCTTTCVYIVHECIPTDRTRRGGTSKQTHSKTCPAVGSHTTTNSSR